VKNKILLSRVELTVGTAVGGVAATSLLNNTVLADSEALDSKERDSRNIGCKASYAGV